MQDDSSLLDAGEPGRELYRNQAGAFNAELTAIVNDSLQASHPMLEELTQLLQSWRQRWASWCDANWETIVRYDSSYAHPEPHGFSTVTLDSEADLSLTTSWVSGYGTPEARLEPVNEVLDDIFRGIIAPQKRMDAQARLKHFLSKAFPLGDHDTLQATFQLHDLQHADPMALLKAEFTRSLHALSVMEATLTQVLEDRENCVRSEDVRGAEERSLEAVTNMKSIIEVAFQRLRETIAASAEVEQYEENVAAARNEVERLVLDAQRENTTFVQQAQHDNQVLLAFEETYEQDSAEKGDLYLQRSAKFKAAVQDNTKQQLTVFEQVIQQLQQLNALAQAREELVHAHLNETIQEKSRIQHRVEVRAAIADRKKELDAIVVNCQRALDYLGNNLQYVAKAEEYIRRLQFPTKLQKSQVEEALRSYDIYKRYILAANTILYRKEQRLENVRRLIRSTEFQIANAVDTLDTDLPLYRQQLASLTATELQLSSAAQEIADDLETQRAKWEFVEGFLEERRVEYDPPTLMVQELKRDMMQHHVEAVDELTNKEQKLLDGEKANVRKMLNAVEAAKEAFRDRKGGGASPSPTR